jgi:hypothetical protein
LRLFGFAQSKVNHKSATIGPGGHARAFTRAAALSFVPSGAMDELLSEFLTETGESLELVDVDTVLDFSQFGVTAQMADHKNGAP